MLRVIADVTDPDLIRKILAHVNNRAPPRRAPGHRVEFADSAASEMQTEWLPGRQLQLIVRSLERNRIARRRTTNRPSSNRQRGPV
jgi:hypothetical protein